MEKYFHQMIKPPIIIIINQDRSIFLSLQPTMMLLLFLVKAKMGSAGNYTKQRGVERGKVDSRGQLSVSATQKLPVQIGLIRFQ